MIREASKIFTRKEEWYSLVLVVEDFARPEFNGTIQIMPYGKKVKEKIAAEVQGLYGEPCNPFSPAAGKDFFIEVSELGGYPNWDRSRFAPEATSIEIDGVRLDPQTDKEMFMKWIQQAPKTLSDYASRPWGEEELSQAHLVISTILPTFNPTK
jgi:hypothetical protein